LLDVIYIYIYLLNKNRADLLHPEKEIQYSLKNFKDNL